MSIQAHPRHFLFMLLKTIMTTTELIFLTQTFLILLTLHFLADFPLQGEFLAKGKNSRTNPPEVWITCLIAHCTIHAGLVFAFTEELSLAAIMFITHACVDMLKCNGDLGEGPEAFAHDQIMHVVIIAVIASLYVGM